RLDHHRDPATRKSIGIALVKGRHDFLGQHANQMLGVSFVSDLVRHVLRTIPDGKSILTVVCLGPPAIQDRSADTSFITTFIPLVHEASRGHRVLFSQKSAPCTMFSATLMS